MLSRMVLASALVLGLGACGSAEAPTGQVAATLDGEEFTFLQIDQELASRGDIAPEDRAAASREALQRLLQLHILAEEATDRGLDSAPSGASHLERVRKATMADLLKSDIRSSVPETSEDEASQFVADNRLLFAERYILIVRQLVVPAVPADVIAKMEPIDTLPGIQSLLEANSVEYRKTMGTVDSITLDPEVAKQISDLAVGDVYVVPQGGGARVNVIVSKELFPITGDDAVRVAKKLVFDQRVTGQTNTGLNQLVAERMKSVMYADDFAPVAQKEAAEEASPSAEDAETEVDNAE